MSACIRIGESEIWESGTDCYEMCEYCLEGWTKSHTLPTALSYTLHVILLIFFQSHHENKRTRRSRGESIDLLEVKVGYFKVCRYVLCMLYSS